MQCSSAYVCEMYAGNTNKVADALSRQFSEAPSLLLSISSPVPSIITQLQQYFKKNEEGKELVSKIQTDSNMQACFTVQDDLIYFKGRFYIPDVLDLRHSLIQEYHAFPSAGHSALKPSLAHLTSSFYQLSWSHSDLGYL